MATPLNIYHYINKDNKSFVIIQKTIAKDLKHQLEMFDLDGNKITFATDSCVNKESGMFTREINKVKLTLCNNSVYLYEISDKLPLLKPFLNKNLNTTRNTLIGSFDMETYKNSASNKSEVYGLGYKTLNSPQSNKFYIEKDLSSEDLVVKCVKSMLSNKNNGYVFFVHNFSRFDVYFLLKALTDYNRKHNDYFILKPQFRTGNIIKLKVGIKTSKTNSVYISFVDSYLLLNKSLHSLCLDFNTDVVKDIFCHSFVNENSLFYKGRTPDINYFNNISQDEYNKILSENWDLKAECLKYLDKDLYSLLEIMDKFNKYIFDKYDIQITESLTLSRIGINILKSKYKINKHLPLINKPSIHDFIKQGYYGGISDVYKPYGRNLYYYDVNSEYPYVARNKMIGNSYTYVEDILGDGLNLENLFGFFYCEVKAPENLYLGLLPILHNGTLVSPKGEFSGVWFSEELKFAKENGYEVKVIKGYNFNAVDGVFNSFVDDLFKTRQDSSGMIKSITKLLLNAPFGRFGMSIHQPKESFVNHEEFKYILSTRIVNSFEEINDNLYLIGYIPQISKITCENNGLDYIEGVKNNTSSSFSKGYVDISTKDVVLKGDSYTKRTKIYNDKNQWIDTAPLELSNDK